MPLPLLFALFLAFGLESAGPFAPLPNAELGRRVTATFGLVTLVSLASMGLGFWVSARVARSGHASQALRRGYSRCARILEILILVSFSAIIHQWEWPRVVRTALGRGSVTVVEEALILLPFVLMQLVSWWGLYPAEKKLRAGFGVTRTTGRGRYVMLRARQTLGLVLPVLVVFSLGQDLVSRQWPALAASAWALPFEVCLMGLLVLVLSPVFIRLAWPTRPLPHGPLRERLEHQAQRLGFRCSDILIWDTGQSVVNACVTGSLPRFRYVLLTDALIDCLNDHEIAAVFGHEIGHIAHRHLLYFGFFFLGSLGVLALLGEAIDPPLLALSNVLGGQSHPILATIIQAVMVLLTAGLYFLVVFGHVSRRFERQADVFGCRAVSCDRAECPPHHDLDRQPGRGSSATGLCPVGIRIFANALTNVATLNGMEFQTRSWRHGSIARRIAFLEGLEGKPEAVIRFQSGVSRLRAVVALVLVLAVLIALATGSVEHLR
ncbi:M48 family metallopeptidase [Singulisphaera acidiphila]|uniref:Zn-dependent protease with chaperone function n=1 Tax=Singulisphaera acidiphila (strain ATCC BAA-1392 / DSM 18658 / VKM B-2454 / MOB10) TaxID=886293 RepID=L0DF35_SINAD|nr:M48 family metallopeptidase [Singulisphaera acidiphila]AGA27465.1 Zn-dependent protease with chaperone function [Singulisphaera acidiphila DSM 18658]